MDATDVFVAMLVFLVCAVLGVSIAFAFGYMLANWALLLWRSRDA